MHIKKVVTVTLGSSKQDFSFETQLLGQSFTVKRMGADDGKAWDRTRRFDWHDSQLAGGSLAIVL